MGIKLIGTSQRISMVMKNSQHITMVMSPSTISGLGIWLVAPMAHRGLFTFYKRVSLKPPTRSPCVPTAGAGRPDIGLDGPGRRSAGPGL